ncbi:MAG: DUF5672 family protein [Aquabacterium sp.]
MNASVTMPAPLAADRTASCVVVVPIYREGLEPLERFSLDYSFERLQGRDLVFIAPERLDTSFYQANYPGVPVLRFADDYFASIKGYNRLLLDPAFYERFHATHEFMLILQTDAIILRDELDHWCSLPYDYVGAPWPDGLEVTLNLDCFGGAMARKVRAHVGNGGLSLRRNAACAALLREFPQATDMFLRSGSSEDLFFSLMGTQSERFVVPNERVASLFALELTPETYLAVNQGRAPMGGHAWWRYNQPFWVALLEQTPPVLVPAAAPGRPVLSANVVGAAGTNPSTAH